MLGGLKPHDASGALVFTISHQLPPLSLGRTDELQSSYDENNMWQVYC